LDVNKKLTRKYKLYVKYFYLAYSHAESNEFGYNIAQRDIKYENNTAELTCFVSKTILPVIWNKIDIHGLNEPIKIAEGKTLIIDDSRFSIKIHSTGLLITLKVNKLIFIIVIIIRMANKQTNGTTECSNKFNINVTS